MHIRPKVPEDTTLGLPLHLGNVERKRVKARLSRFRKKSRFEGVRVIIVLKGLDLGGTERQALLLARRLAHEHGAETQIWGLGGESGRVAKFCEEYSIKWRTVPFRLHRKKLRLVKDLWKLTWTLRTAKPDVVLPYLDVPNIGCGLVWRLTGARLCIWNQRAIDRNHMDRLIAKIAIRLTPKFVSNSKAGADGLVRDFRVNPESVHVIQNGVELARPILNRAEWRRLLAVDKNCFVICMVAHFATRKDHFTLLRAWPRILEKLNHIGKDAILVFAGSFYDTHASAGALVDELGINGSVRFLGEVGDISGLLYAADLGVLTSNVEGCPNAVLEYMAAGLPVVATCLPGIREAVGPENEHYLVPLKDSEAIADCIIRLAMAPDLQAKLGAYNRHRVKTEFSPKQLYERTTALIFDGLRDRGG